MIKKTQVDLKLQKKKKRKKLVKVNLKLNAFGTFLVVQWLGLCPPRWRWGAVRELGWGRSIPDGGTKTPCSRVSKNIKKQTNTECLQTCIKQT